MMLANAQIWPFSAKLFVTGLLFVIMVSIGYQLDTSSCWDILLSRQAQSQKLQHKVEQQQRDITHLATYKTDLQASQNTFATLVKSLPVNEQIPDLLEDIAQASIAHDLELKVLKPLAEKQQGVFVEIPIQINGTGYYYQLMQFIKQVAQLSWLVVIRDFNIKTIDIGADKLELTMIVTTYRYKNNSDKSIAKTMVAADKLRNPFHVDKKDPLVSFPLSSLKLIGTIVQGDKALAVVTTPDAKVYPVKYGAYLGQHEGQVTHIVENKIEVTEASGSDARRQRVVVLVIK